MGGSAEPSATYGPLAKYAGISDAQRSMTRQEYYGKGGQQRAWDIHVQYVRKIGVRRGLIKNLRRQGWILTDSGAERASDVIARGRFRELVASLNPGGQRRNDGDGLIPPAKGAKKLPQPAAKDEFLEGERIKREAVFFARNQSLAKSAKEKYKYVCQCCGFDFLSQYGELGKEFIECHHLNPLSERPQREWTKALRTSIDEVTVLCANCHRMVHRRKPALPLKQLKIAFRWPDILPNGSPLRAGGN